MVSARSQVTGSESPSSVSNSYEVFKLMENYNLKLILQGHIHWKEYGFVNLNELKYINALNKLIWADLNKFMSLPRCSYKLKLQCIVNNSVIKFIICIINSH